MAFHTAGPGRALVQRALVRLSRGVPKPSFHTAATAGPSVGGSRPDPQSASPTGPSVDGHRPGPQSAGPNLVFTRRALTGFLYGGRRLNLHTRALAGL